MDFREWLNIRVPAAFSRLALRYILGSNVLSQMTSRKIHHIVGSAPGEIGGVYSPAVWLTCVNASIARVNRNPDLWIITDQLFDTTKNANHQALEHIVDRQCGLLLVVTRGYSKALILETLNAHRIKYTSIKFVGGFHRAAICQYHSGIASFFKRYRPSNGVFAIVISVISGRASTPQSRKVCVEGIDPTTVNHFYKSDWGSRGHIQADTITMQNLTRDRVVVQFS